MDLSLVPIQDLYNELFGRFDHAVFVGKQIVNDGKNTSRRWKGDHHMAMGLCLDASEEILNDLIEKEKPLTNEDL